MSHFGRGRMRSRRAWRVVREWLFPLAHMQTWSGWLSVLWVIAVFFLPTACAALATKLAPVNPGWWITVPTLVILLLLALAGLWRNVPNDDLHTALTWDLAGTLRFTITKE